MIKGLKDAVSEALKPKVQCCFCGEPIKDETPIMMSLDLGDDQFQSMYAHGGCLQERLHPSVPFLPPGELNDD